MRRNKKLVGFAFLLTLFFFSLFSFPSFCSPVSADWAFVILGDSREDFRRDHVFPKMLQEINETAYRIKDREVRPEFLLHLGDFELRWGTRESLERFQERMKGLHLKYFVAKGNHELVEPRTPLSKPSIQEVLKANQDFVREYKSFFGLKQTYFSFDHRDLHVVVLDNSFGTFQVRPGEDVRAPQFDWLKKDLEETARKVEAGETRHTILCAHIPLPASPSKVTTHDMAEYTSGRYSEGKKLAEESAENLWEILEPYRQRSRIRGLYFAHDHRYVSYRQRELPVTITGGAGAVLMPEERGGFYHYIIVVVTELGLKERIIKVYPSQ